MLIGGRLWVGPPSERPADGNLAVVIEQGHAFGSGAHATATGLSSSCSASSTTRARCSTSAAAREVSRSPRCGSATRRSSPATTMRWPSRQRARTSASTRWTSRCSRPTRPRTSCRRADLWIANLAKGPLSDVLARPDARRVARSLSGVSQTTCRACPAGASSARSSAPAGTRCSSQDEGAGGLRALDAHLRAREPVPQRLVVGVEDQPEVVRDQRRAVGWPREPEAERAGDALAEQLARAHAPPRGAQTVVHDVHAEQLLAGLWPRRQANIDQPIQPTANVTRPARTGGRRRRTPATSRASRPRR